MPISITNESKNTLTITNDDKPVGGATWEDMAISWDDTKTTWGQPGTPLVPESKNTITITNENKN